MTNTAAALHAATETAIRTMAAEINRVHDAYAAAVRAGRDVAAAGLLAELQIANAAFGGLVDARAALRG